MQELQAQLQNERPHDSNFKMVVFNRDPVSSFDIVGNIRIICRPRFCVNPDERFENFWVIGAL